MACIWGHFDKNMFENLSPPTPQPPTPPTPVTMEETNFLFEYSFNFWPLVFDLSGAETRILQASWVNKMVADILLPSVARSSATNLLV